MPQSKANVYILILNYNSSKDTVALYDQLQKIEHNNYFILVIDNNSTDNSTKILSNYIPKANLILNKKNLGYAGGNNIGIRQAINAGAEYVWILNPDIRVEKNTLNVLLDTIGRDNKIAAIGPRICDRRNKEIIFSDGGILDVEKGFKTGHLNNGKKIDNIDKNIKFKEIDYVDGSCFLINLSCIEHIGILKENFFLYFEETEWCLRAKNQGWKLLAVYETRCFHLPSTKKFRYFYYMTRNRIYLSILIKRHILKTVWLELKLILDCLLKLHITRILYKSIGLIGGILLILPYLFKEKHSD